MAPEEPRDASPRKPLDDLLGDWLEARRAGRALPTEAWLRDHPGEAERLRHGIDAISLIEHALQRGPLPPRTPGDSVLSRLDPAARPASVSLREASPDPAPPFAPRPGSQGRYLVEGEIARGGMGVILKGQDADLGREVAIKVLRDDLAGRPDLVRRFVEEAQIGGQLQHPGIVPVHELGLDGEGLPYFTMKLVRGQTLARLLRDREDAGRERRRLIGIFESICQTMAYAHARGVIHRDLKPANVMVGAFGEVLVVDWGMAKVLGPGTAAPPRAASPPGAHPALRVGSGTRGSQSLAGSVMGTPGYMAPEQARGEVETLDERADVFSLGAILCETLTGAPPYPGTHEEALRLAEKAHMADAHRRLGACGADPDLVSLAKACLSPERSDRPSDASALAARVSAYLASLEERRRQAEAEAQRAGVRAEEERKRRRLSVGLAAAVLGLVFLGGGGAWWMEAGRRERSRTASAAVSAALEETAALRARAAANGDAAVWSEALASARHASTLAQSAEADIDLRARAGLVLAEVEADAGIAQHAAERARFEQRIVERLDEIRQVQVAEGTAESLSEVYRLVFRDLGLEAFGAAEPGEVGARIREAKIHQHLLGALDLWSYGLERSSREWSRLQAILAVADPDPWRSRVRGTEGAEALRTLAAELDVEGASREDVQLMTIALLEARDAEPANRLAAAWCRRAPDDFAAHYLAAICARDGKPRRVEVALRHATACIALRPSSHMAHGLLGNLLEEAGEPERACAAQREAVRLSAGHEWHAGHMHNLGNALRRAKDPTGAIEAYRAALAEDPTRGRTRGMLGGTLLQIGEFAEAIPLLREAVRLDPRHAGFHSMLGRALLQAGPEAREEALGAYRKAVEVEPQLAQRHADLGWALQQGGPFDAGEVVACYRKAVELDANDPLAWNELGEALLLAKDPSGALEAFRRTIALRADFATAHYNLARALEELEDPVGAAEAYRKAIHLSPDDAESHCNLGLLLSWEGQFAEALEFLQRGHELGKTRPHWTYPSDAWVRQTRAYARAEKRLPDVIAGKEQISDPEEILRFADVCCRKKLFAAAAALYARHLALAPPERPSEVWWSATAMAARAGTGEGVDAPSLDDAGRAALRRQALDALRWYLADLVKTLDAGSPVDPLAVTTLRTTPELAGLRDPGRLASLPPEEQAALRAWWAGVDALEARIAGK